MSNRFPTAAVVAVFAAAVLAVSVSATFAQDINLSNGADQLWRGVEAQSNAGIWLDHGQVSASDGRRDLIVGAPGAAGVLGRVYVIYGGPTRTGDVSLGTADAILTGADPGDLFGSAAVAGNIINQENALPRNLVVSAPNAMGGRGVVYLFAAGFGNAARLNTTNATLRIVGAPGDQLGTSLATGDLNNDGYREIIIGAPGTNRVYVINGGPSLSGTRDLETQPADTTLTGTGFGRTLAAGDVTGDNIHDLLVGSVDLNAVYLYRGRVGGVPTGSAADAGFFGVKAGDQVGASVRLADLDSDNIRDVIIGAPGADGPGDSRADAGAVYVIWGSTSLATRSVAQADVTFHGALAGHQLGSFLNAGDINRDTPDDLVMLAPGAASGAGELIVYYGRSNRATYGVNAGDGRRIVDLATASNIDRKIIGDSATGAIRVAQAFEVTGEGARDIIVGVPSADSSAGRVFFTSSPRLRLSATSLIIRAKENGAAAAAVEVSNPSVVGVTWSATSNRPWMTVTGSGSTVNGGPGTLTIQTSAAGVARGVYSGTVTVKSTSKHLDMFVTVNVTFVVRPALTVSAGDYDGDAISELSVYRPSNGTWYILKSNGGYTRADAFPWGVSTDLPVPADFDGDNRKDIAVYRPSSGHWFILNSGANFGTSSTYQWGGDASDIPMAADYDGDGKADLAVYRQANGTWYILKSSTSYMAADAIAWGTGLDMPVTGDFDGDGRADIAVYRPQTGHWFIKYSMFNYSTTGTYQWGGASGDIPVPADYDGDGITDLAVYRPSNGTWYILKSSTSFTTAAAYAWGANTDKPMPADFDGDGRADIVVFRPATGHWFVLKSTSNYGTSITYQWGTGGDVPVAK